MDKKHILYSIDEKITIKNLKELNNFEIDKNKENSFLEYCNRHNIKSIFWTDINLKKTKPIPYILYYIWNIDILKNKKIIGIVWPRNITTFIENQLKNFFEKIKNLDNIAIISWLADGTDSLAHKLSIKHNIPTISILWFWIAKWLNWTSRHLIKDIVENNGLILSEFKLKQPWTNWTFPQRNRIIAWLSDILFVPQAKENSWTFITIDKAIEYNIPIYSCFSKIDDSNWYWTNKYIKYKKINWIFDMDIFIEELKEKFNIKGNTRKDIKKELYTQLNKDEKLIIHNIQNWNNTIDSLIWNLQLNETDIINTISIMELNWILKEDNWEYKIIL